MKSETPILISIKTFSGQGTALMKQGLTQLKEQFKVVGVSSVYKVDRVAESFTSLRDIRKEERLEGFALVMRATTTLSASQTLQFLISIEKELQREVLKRSASLNLMAYGSQMIMLPELSLPHPELHLRPEEIVPAVEVWADYMHPVLQLTLQELSLRFAQDKWGEFYTQGPPLLDF